MIFYCLKYIFESINEFNRLKKLQALKNLQIKQPKLKFLKIYVGIRLKLKLINKMIVKIYISSMSLSTDKNDNYIKLIINIIFKHICFNNIIILIQCTIRRRSKQ